MGKLCTVTFIRENKEIQVEAGENLLKLMRKLQMHPDAPCGGSGICGKCKVNLLELHCASENYHEEKACEYQITENLLVDTRKSASMEILTSGEVQETEYRPLIQQKQLHVMPCEAGKSTSDWQRFTIAAEDPLLEPNLSAASRIGILAKKNKGILWGIFSGHKLLSVQDRERAFCMAAFDIGTTTIVGYLLDGKDGFELSVASCQNPQVSYGADVIHRANYAITQDAQEVTACVRSAMNQLLEELTEKAGVQVKDILGISIAGNTCMHHLFLGIDVNSLVHAPYNPVIEKPLILNAADYGIFADPEALLFVLPNIAGFVGADTVAGLAASDLADQTEWTLLVDIGTNGEMVLGRQEEMIACSTAAGPAFEGAGIRYGMRGSEGAICHGRWKENGWELQTISDKPPRGICGSGLLDLAAELLRTGQMDETGAFAEGTSILVAGECDSASGERITLEQKDIRELQLAKAAIASGIKLLAKEKGISVSDIQHVWLAGAFGNYMSRESACRIGLLPGELEERIVSVGNAAGEGAKRVLRNREYWSKAEYLAQKCEFLELASLPEFQDLFVDELEFPES